MHSLMMSTTTMDFMGEENKEGDARLVKKPYANSPNDDAAASKHLHPSPSKKLEELRDEDIMQLTRKDCRRYLKEKGMRRPSWNKGQAIQQVLSLRSLCDPKPCHESSCSMLPMNSNNKNSGGHLSDTFKSAGATPQAPRCTVSPMQEMNLPSTLSMPSENKAFEPAATKRSLSPCFDSARKKQMTTGQLPDQATFSASGTTSTTSTSSKAPSAQLTMFYAGTVTVFEDLPADKAYAIMLLAKSWPSNTIEVRASMAIVSRRGILELPQARKASLQRFLQKRRERINQIGSKKDASSPIDPPSEKMPPTSNGENNNCGEQLNGTGEGKTKLNDVESSH